MHENNIERKSSATFDSKRNIDEETIKILNQLCKDTNSEIVVSSTWRLNRTVEELQQVFDSSGGSFKVFDKTGSCCSGVRGVEILNWTNKNKEKFKNYAILDDEGDMLLWQANHFFQVDRFVGLTPTTCYKIVRFLNGVD